MWPVACRVHRRRAGGSNGIVVADRRTVVSIPAHTRILIATGKPTDDVVRPSGSPGQKKPGACDSGERTSILRRERSRQPIDADRDLTEREPTAQADYGESPLSGKREGGFALVFDDVDTADPLPARPELQSVLATPIPGTSTAVSSSRSVARTHATIRASAAAR